MISHQSFALNSMSVWYQCVLQNHHNTILKLWTNSNVWARLNSLTTDCFHRYRNLPCVVLQSSVHINSYIRINKEWVIKNIAPIPVPMAWDDEWLTISLQFQVTLSIKRFIWMANYLWKKTNSSSTPSIPLPTEVQSKFNTSRHLQSKQIKHLCEVEVTLFTGKI